MTGSTAQWKSVDGSVRSMVFPLGAAAILEVLEQLSEWIDAVFSLGWRAAGQTHKAAGERIVNRLEEAGLLECASALRKTLTCSDSEIASTLGRLTIVLEMTNESLEIERFNEDVEIAG